MVPNLHVSDIGRGENIAEQQMTGISVSLLLSKWMGNSVKTKYFEANLLELIWLEMGEITWIASIRSEVEKCPHRDHLWLAAFSLSMENGNVLTIRITSTWLLRVAL